MTERSSGSGSPRWRILFVATNGVGMGHLTRAMAIARRLPESVQPLLLTWSQALPLVRGLGFYVEYLPSHQYLGSEVRPWNALLRTRLNELCESFAPSLIVYDGIQPHEAFGSLAETRPGVGRVWCRRALWRAGQAESNVDGARFFDGVLEPGDVAESLDTGATVPFRSRAHRVPPVIFPASNDLLPREEARGALGLDPARPATLVQLGAATDFILRVCRGLIELGHSQVVLARSPLEDPAPAPDGCLAVDAYPIARYYRAFDHAVAAPGYNAFHELLRFDVPTLFVPNPNAVVDDQPARARFAAANGLATTCDDAGLNDALQALVEGPRPPRLADAARELAATDGAGEAANHLARRLGVEG